jgi:hypothetical protein
VFRFAPQNRKKKQHNTPAHSERPTRGLISQNSNVAAMRCNGWLASMVLAAGQYFVFTHSPLLSFPAS